MAKEKSLKTLKVRVNKDGTLSKKSLEDIQKLDKPGVAEKLIPQVNLRDGVLVGTFAGLTVGYKTGVIDLLTPFLTGGNLDQAKTLGLAAVFGAGGLGIAQLWDAVDKQMEANRIQILKNYRKEHEDAIKKLEESEAGAPYYYIETGMGIKVKVPQTKEDEIKRRREYIAIIDKKLGDTEGIRAETAQVAEATKWLISMGLAGATIYLFQSHRVAEFVELLPGQ